MIIAWFFSFLLFGQDVPTELGFYTSREVCEQAKEAYKLPEIEATICYTRAVTPEDTEAKRGAY